MTMPDLNLLHTLDVLLQEGSVARAARRLRLSPSAMSRTLSRLRETTGDPLLVRAGRGLIPTPRALELRDTLGPLVQAAISALRPAEALNLQQLHRTFTLRTREGFAETFGPQLLAWVATQAPAVRLCFVSKTDKSSSPLREGTVDMETGIISKDTAPELRTVPLFKDQFVGVVRAQHPFAQTGAQHLAQDSTQATPLTAPQYAAAQHIGFIRQGLGQEHVDAALESLGLVRNIATQVSSFGTAIALARNADLIACVPQHHTAGLRSGMHSFALPVPTPALEVSLLWHPRHDADPAHRWLRHGIREVCAQCTDPTD